MSAMGLVLALAGCSGSSDKAQGDDCASGQSCAGSGADAGASPTLEEVGRPDVTTPEPEAPSSPEPDASPDPNAAICPLEDSDDVCSVCLKFSCCEQIIACDEACQELVQCASACPSTEPSDPCAQRCFEQHPQGAAAFSAFAGCVGVQCEVACSAPN